MVVHAIWSCQKDNFDVISNVLVFHHTYRMEKYFGIKTMSLKSAVLPTVQLLHRQFLHSSGLILNKLGGLIVFTLVCHFSCSWFIFCGFKLLIFLFCFKPLLPHRVTMVREVGIYLFLNFSLKCCVLECKSYFEFSY